ncbi:hypothetical protein GOBAR_DD07220 [Gossypium barbadense]|nr:hypothetical protein GOBAR_DD07220 [Gossypium barbadense]
MGIVRFDDSSRSNVAGNLLPSHPDQGVNAIIKKGMLKGVRSYCEFHAKEGHEIHECAKFRALVQSLMDNKELEFFEDVKGLEGGYVCASEKGSMEKVNKVNHSVWIHAEQLASIHTE